MEEEITVMKGGAFNIAGRLGKALLGFLLTIYLARFLEPHGFGLLSIGLAMISIFYVFSEMGFSQSMLFHIPNYMGSKKKGEAKYVYDFTKKTILLLSTVSFLVLFFFSDIIAVYIYHTAELGPLLRIFSFALLFQTGFVFYKVVFQSFRNMKYYMWVDIILGLTKFIALFLIIIGWGIFGAFSGHVVAYLLVLLFGLYVVLSDKIALPKKPKKVDSKPLFNLAMNFFVLSLLGLFFGSLTNAFIGFLLDPTNVGYFSIAITLSSIIIMIPQSLGDSLQPFISENLSKKSEARETIKRVMKYSALITIPMSGGIIFLRESIIRFLYGAAYMGASTVIIPIVAGFCLVGTFWAFIPLIYGSGKVRIEVESNVFKAIVNVALCFLLIPAVGVVGAGVAQLSMITVGFSYAGFKIKKHISFEIPWNSIFKSTIATGVMLLVLSTVQWIWGGWLKLVILGGLGVGLYFGLIYLMRELDDTDIRFIRSIMRRFGL
jgi:O-antigen/teichoic acid export membrane protein